jgi:hypothetical protein
MEITRTCTAPPSRPGSYRLVKLTVAGLVVMTGVFGLLTSAAFAAGTLTKTSWSVSNSQTGKTAVTYAFAFTTATASGTNLTSVTMSVPAGTAGTVATGVVYGLGAGTSTFASNLLTYTLTTPAPLAANLPVYVAFTGLTNTTTSNSYTSTITTIKTGPTTVDSATTAAVIFGPSSTGVTVTVAQTLTFTNNMPNFSLVIDPTSLNNSQTQVAILSVQTNAVGGYTLAASDTGLSRSVPAFSFTPVSAGPGTGVATFPTTAAWGCSATLSGAGTDGAALAAGLTGGKFVGYPTTAANFLTTTGATGGTPDTLTITDQVGVDYTVPDGSYSDTITYVVTPTY